MNLRTNLTFGVFAALASLTGDALVPTVAHARQATNTTTRQVKFPTGKASVSYTGSVRGYATWKYEIAGRAGQTFSIRLTSQNTFVYCNVINKRTGTVVTGSPTPREVTRWSGRLPENGTYVVVVYLARAEARRERKADFNVTLTLSSGNGMSSGSGVQALNFTASGSGLYYISDRQDGVPVSKLQLLLNRDRTARIEVSLGGDGFMVSGRWRQVAENAVYMDITRGFDNSPLKGTARITLRNPREWEKIDFNFDFPRQKTLHRLTYKRTSATTASLRGTRWELVEILYNDDKVVRPAAGETMTVAFETANQVTGTAALNRFTGSYFSGVDSSLKFSSLAATRMADPPGSIAPRFLRDLESANHYLFDKGLLILQLPVDAGIMKFKRVAQ